MCCCGGDPDVTGHCILPRRSFYPGGASIVTGQLLLRSSVDRSCQPAGPYCCQMASVSMQHVYASSFTAFAFRRADLSAVFLPILCCPVIYDSFLFSTEPCFQCSSTSASLLLSTSIFWPSPQLDNVIILMLRLSTTPRPFHQTLQSPHYRYNTQL